MSQVPEYDNPYYIRDESYFYDPKTGRYNYRVKGKFTKRPEPDYYPPAPTEPVYEDYEEEYEEPSRDRDWSPWISVESSRCKAVRYDFTTKNLLMAWSNGKPAWVYRNVSVEDYEAFLGTGSHGQYVNNVLNNYGDRNSIGSDELKYFEGHDDYAGV